MGGESIHFWADPNREGLLREEKLRKGGLINKDELGGEIGVGGIWKYACVCALYSGFCEAGGRGAEVFTDRE